MERAPAFGDRFAVQWHLTSRCAGRCTHCYHHEARGELSIPERREVFDEIVAFLRARGVPGRIHFAGGEPLLAPDLVQLVRAARERGILSRVLTSGVGVTPALAATLAAAGCAGVQVSVEGPEPVHDAIRGEGSFRAAFAGARLLTEAGVEVTLALTLHRENLESLEALPELARGIATRIYVSRLVAIGGGASLAPLERAEWGRAIERLLAIGRRDQGRLEVAMRDPTFRPCFLSEEVARSAPVVAGCGAGYHTLTIESDGTVMPCRRLDLAIGRLGAERLETIWHESPLLAALRDRDHLGGRCRRCPYRWVCGGCRAIARARTGDPLAADPGCPWRALSLGRLARGARRWGANLRAWAAAP
jgi:radical SAM protein with 4Fe4S-binding SPASM domain